MPEFISMLLDLLGRCPLVHHSIKLNLNPNTYSTICDPISQHTGSEFGGVGI